MDEDEYDALASVDTEVDEVGLAELSCCWLEWSERPQVVSVTYMWHLLFPSVAILLNDDKSYSCRRGCQRNEESDSGITSSPTAQWITFVSIHEIAAIQVSTE